MKCTGLKAVSYLDTRMLIKGSTVKLRTMPVYFIFSVMGWRLIFIKMEEISINKQKRNLPELERTCDLKEITMIEWVDAHEKEQQWDSMEETLDWAEQSNWNVKQVGFILFENDEYLLLSSQIAEPEKNKQKVGNATKIPKGWIVSRTNLQSV